MGLVRLSDQTGGREGLVRVKYVFFRSIYNDIHLAHTSYGTVLVKLSEIATLNPEQWALPIAYYNTISKPAQFNHNK